MIFCLFVLEFFKNQLCIWGSGFQVLENVIQINKNIYSTNYEIGNTVKILSFIALEVAEF